MDRKWPMALAFGSLAALGAVLRLFQIDRQILIDDEWHAIVKLATSDYWAIATSFGVVDHSIPLTLLFKWIADQGLLSEYSMLALPLLSGSLLCGLLVVMARRVMAPLALATFAGLLALSPLLILYSRQARPYALTLFLSVIALWAAYRWDERVLRKFAAIHVVAAALAVYLHPVVAPAIFGGWIYLLLSRARRTGRDWRALAEVVAPGAVTLAVVSALLTPALVSGGGGSLA
jgi:hypothetical protein